MTTNERRKFQRLPAMPNVTVCYKNIAGQVLDISPGGLAFQYNMWDDGPEDCNADDETLALLLLSHSLFLKNIPCRTVADRPVGELSPWSRSLSRRKSMAFEAMSKELQEKVRYFILQATGTEEGEGNGDNP